MSKIYGKIPVIRSWTWVSVLMLAQVCRGQSAFPVQVVGGSSTQAVLSYTAPSTSSCQVEVSENAGYTPLVHDVDPGLFAGANSDQRSGNVTAGTSRTLVVGKRSAEVAGNGKTYSRALQANTTHYFRITCGSSVSTGSFVTGNIPLGMTYIDLPPTTIPTIDTSAPVVDPQTGALTKVAAPATNHGNLSQAYMGASGYARMCSNDVVGPDNGYLCAFYAADGGVAVGYYYVPSTGEMRYIGSYWIPWTPDWDMTGIAYPQPGVVTYYTFANRAGTPVFIKGTYTGNYTAVSPGSPISMTWTPVTLQGTDALSTLKLLNPNVSSPTACNLLSTEDHYGLIDCRSGYQDSYAYAIGVIDLNTGNAIAARPMMSAYPMRFCGEHNYHFLAPGIPVVELQSHQLNGGSAGPNGVGGGPYLVTLAAAINATTTTINVIGEPVAPNPGDLAMTAQVGDLILINNTELVKIDTKVSSTQWIVERGWGGYYTASAHSAGETGEMECGGLASANTAPSTPYWTFLSDPLGQNLIINRDWPIGGHDDAGANLHLTEGYLFTQGPILNILQLGPQQSLTSHPNFAGSDPYTDGNAAAAHPSYNQINNPNWFVDARAFDGGNSFSQTHVHVSGQLYKYTFANFLPNMGIHPKILPTLSFTGGQQLTDISGPGSLIADDTSMPNTSCVANKAGECRPNSAAGDVYANIPNLQNLYCYGGDGPNPTVQDWCVTDSPPMGETIMQLGIVPNRAGLWGTDPSSMLGIGWSRTLSRGFGPVRGMTTVAKTTPDGQYLFFNQVVNGAFGPLLMLKMLPFEQQDTVDRTTFIPVTVTIPANAQAAGAVVQFGYSEFGSPGQGYCTTRREACVAVSSTLDATNPFKFQTSDSYSALPCTSGCQIIIPLAPQHVAYYQVLYLDSSHNVIAVGPQGVATEGNTSSVIPPPGFVLVSPGSATLSGSQSVQFTATVTGLSSNSVTWSLSPSVGSISNGLYIAPSVISTSQTVTVTATSTADPTKSASASVQLTANAGVSLSLSPLSATLSASQTSQFTATVTGSANTSVTWSINPSVGSVSNGLYTAPAIINASQTVVVTATSVADPSKSAAASITLAATVSNPLSLAITSPTSQPTFTATQNTISLGGTASPNTTQVTWATDQGGVRALQGQAVGTANWTANGITLRNGSNRITVTAQDASGNQSSTVLTVTFNPPAITITSLPIAQAGQPYSYSLSTVGGTPPFTWSVAPLPAGLTASGNGVITGTPVTPGLFTLNLSVQDSFQVSASATVSLQVTSGLSLVSAASLTPGPVAPESWAAAFGNQLADGTASIPTSPVPTQVGNSTVTVRDANGVTRAAGLNYASPTHVNFTIPSGTAVGTATVTIYSGTQVRATGTVNVQTTAPGLFFLNQAGLADAGLLRVQGTSYDYESVVTVDSQTGQYVALPINLGAPTDQVYLTLYGTGLRFRPSLDSVSVTIGGVPGSVVYAGPALYYDDVDIVNVLLPQQLRGRGNVNIVLSVSGQLANSVNVQIQ